MNEPLIKAMRKARAEHKKTHLGRLEELLKEGRKWSRRATIAENKIKWHAQRLVDYCAEMARELDKPEGSEHERQS